MKPRSGGASPLTLRASGVIPAAAAGKGALSGRASAETIWHSVISLWHGFISDVPRLVGGIIVLVLIIIVSKLFNRFAGSLLRRFQLKESQRTLITRLSVILLWFLGILTVLTIVFPDLTPTRALAGLGLGSVAIGFAFKDL
jgi:small conductance mechanosensitive channel